MKKTIRYRFLRGLKKRHGCRRGIFGRFRLHLRGLKLLGKKPETGLPKAEKNMRRGFDPELLYVECASCGAPVLWESGRATRLLRQAGIDPLELDAFCMLVTDACPSCSQREEYTVRIFRMADSAFSETPLKSGNA